MTSDQSKPTSLRSLATQLGCSHSALHKAVHDRRLTAGVRIDGRRVFVVDAAAAAAEWDTISRCRIDGRGGQRSQSKAARRLKPDAVIFDRDGYDWTAQGLLDSYDAHDLLARVLINSLPLRRLKAPAFLDHVLAQLHAEAKLHVGYDKETVAYANRVLFTLRAELLYPEDFDDRDDDDVDSLAGDDE